MTTQVVDDRLAISEPPHLAAGSTDLLDVLMDTENDVADIACVIGQHSPIVGRLISLANSAWSNPASPVTSLNDACSRLGLNVVRTVTIAIAVGKSFDFEKCQSFDAMHFWTSSFIAAEISAALAEKSQLDSESARAAGLLHSIGLLWLADCMPFETHQALAETPESEQGVDELVEHHCGIGYRKAGHILLTRWRLPNLLVASLISLDELDAGSESDNMHRLVRSAAELATTTLTPERELALDGLLVDIHSPKTLQRLLDTQRRRLPQMEGIAASLVSERSQNVTTTGR